MIIIFQHDRNGKSIDFYLILNSDFLPIRVNEARNTFGYRKKKEKKKEKNADIHPDIEELVFNGYWQAGQLPRRRWTLFKRARWSSIIIEEGLIHKRHVL